MLSDSRQRDTAHFQVQEEQNIILGCKTAPGEHVNGEEIDTCQYGHV
jgi:hypothetical protein